MQIDKIITDDELINFLLDQHKQTCDPKFMASAHAIARYRHSHEIFSWKLSQYVWISVKEQLPKKFTHVLCLYPSKGHGSNIVVDYMESDRGYFAEQFRYGEPTHWMPLPTPPIEKEN
jgi:hypothetical protein